MFWGISFCVGNKTTEVNGQEFSLGVLTAECLNISLAGSIQKSWLRSWQIAYYLLSEASYQGQH